MSEARKKHGIGLLLPDRFVHSVTEVDPAELKAQGIAGLILDLDNTIVEWQREEMSEEVIGWLQAIKEQGIQLCILSNSFMSDRSIRIAERLEGIAIKKAQKPRRQGFRAAMLKMGTTPAQTAIVGDQMFTDVLGGNRAGIYTIMVQPLHGREFAYTKYVSRPPEKMLLKYFRRRGHL
ncbi:MAG: YqeG family HAD IIIA-type phosphatase [Chthonomonadaceae bacterium]|nr:YqeG family HAD IIIA-type phosphatase [Chthonomonadaceae bacterium]